MIIPQHIAIIMDGNRRWARSKGWEIIRGHRQVAEQGIRELVEASIKLGVKHLTLWAFSTENWQREPGEVKALMLLFREAFAKSSEELHKLGVRIKTIGDLSKFDPDIKQNMDKWVNETKNNQAITVTFALNYGGRDEILRAVDKLLSDAKNQKNFPVNVTEENFTQYLDTAGMPDPELIIRPGGEQRLSGFLLWQSNYAELYFSDVLMPDFNGKELNKAIEEFNRRQRRYGQ